MENKILIQAAAGIGALVIAWLGTSVYVGSNAERNLAAQVQKTAADCSVRLTNLQQQSGLLSGSGKLELHVGDLCNSEQSGKYWVVADVEYNINHLILPNTLMRFNWTLKQPPAPNTAGPTLQLHGSGGTAFSGAVYSDINSQDISGQAEDESWHLEPIAGRFETKGDTLELYLKGSRFTSRGGGKAIDLQGIGLQVSLSDLELGLGKSAFTIDKVGTGTGSGENLRFSSETVQNGDRIDAKMLYALGGLNSMGYSAQDLALEIAINGLYAEGVRTLAAIAKQTKSLQNLTLEDNKRYRTALKQVLNQGFSTGITKLSGTIGNAAAKSALNGQIVIDLKPNGNPQGNIELAKMLRSSGQVSFTGNALDQTQLTQLVQMGFAKATPEGLQAAYDYSAGILKANDRIIDEPQIQQTLMSADSEINNFLNEPQAGAAPEPGLEHVMTSPTEDDADPAQNASTPESAPAQDLLSVSMTGRVSYSDTDAVIEDQTGQTLHFMPDSDIGRLIASQCAKGDTCALIALTDGSREIKALQQLKTISVVPAAPTR